MSRRAPPKLPSVVPETVPAQELESTTVADADSESVQVQVPSESSRRAPPKLTSTVTVTGSTTSTSDTTSSSTSTQPSATAIPSVQDLITSQLPDESTQEKMIRSIAQDPAKITSALKQMNFDGDSVSRIVQDARSNPEMMKEIKKLSKDSGLQHQVQKSLSKGQAQGHGDGQPSRKSIMKMQREMKKAVRETSSGDKAPKIKGVWITVSRKTKDIELLENSTVQDASRKLGVGSSFEVVEKNGLTFVCSTNPSHVNQRNKVLEKLIGKNHGGESIVFSTSPSSSLTSQQFAQLTKKWE